MSEAPWLVYLHGINDGDVDGRWRDVLSSSLESLGYPPIDPNRVIAPRYDFVLDGRDDKLPVPPLTVKTLAGEAARENRRTFERREGALEYTLGRHDRGGAEWLVPQALVHAAVEISYFKQAKNYLERREVRAGVLARVLEKIPASGPVVIVAHSLGTIVAADVLRRLPESVEVTGLVTIGSPLATGRFDVSGLRDMLKEPPTNLGWWANFWNPFDPVSAHRGVAAVFPWMIDFPVATPLNLAVHSATSYLSDSTVAHAVGFGLFGSLSKDLARADVGADRPYEQHELWTMLALRYAHLVARRLSGPLQSRYLGALREVQATALSGMRTWSTEQGKQLHPRFAVLDFDLADPLLEAPAPLPVHGLSKDEAVVPISVVLSGNVLHPFDIAVPDRVRKEALGALTTEMELGRQYGLDAFEADEQADRVLGGLGLGWLKWGAVGAGAALVIAATGGLALAAAAPGLAGAAALTTALASFGPGGMVGGLITAGSLATAGGGSLAFGLASPATSAKSVEAYVAQRLATAELRRRQSMRVEPSVWRDLVATEMEVRRQLERLDEFSDSGSPTLKELRRKVKAVEKALKYLRDHDLEPRLVPAEDAYK